MTLLQTQRPLVDNREWNASPDRVRHTFILTQTQFRHRSCCDLQSSNKVLQPNSTKCNDQRGVLHLTDQKKELQTCRPGIQKINSREHLECNKLKRSFVFNLWPQSFHSQKAGVKKKKKSNIHKHNDDFWADRKYKNISTDSFWLVDSLSSQLTFNATTGRPSFILDTISHM